MSGTQHNSTERKVAVKSPNVIEVFEVQDIDRLAVSGVVTITTDTIFEIKVPLIFTGSRFVVNGGVSIAFIGVQPLFFVLAYTGTDTFISGAGSLESQSILFGATATSVFLDIVSSPLLETSISIQDALLVDWADLGTVANALTFLLRRSTIENCGLGFKIRDTLIVCESIGLFAPALVTGLFRISGQLDRTYHMLLVSASPGATLCRVDPGIGNSARVIIQTAIATPGNLFITGDGSTGTYTAVADAAVAATAITSVNDSSFVARFNFAVGPTNYVGQEVVISGFTTNSAYNGIFILTTVGAGFFEVSGIAFGSDETGSFTSAIVTVTATLHGLSELDTMVIDTDLATDYDGGATIYNVLTNSFQINRTFTVTKTGTWNTNGVDQTDPRVLARLNPNAEDSTYIAAAFVNNNPTSQGTISNNIFEDQQFGTLIQGSTIERFKLIDAAFGIFEYTGKEPFDGLITFDYTVESSGGSVDFRFKWVIDTGGGFVDLPDNVEALVNVGGDAQSITKTFPLSLNTGNQIKPQITRNTGSSSITTIYATIFAQNPH